MNILTENFPVATQPHTGMTLTELRDLRADWLAVAREFGYLEACRLVARTLGDPEPGPVGWPGWSIWNWSSAGVLVQFFEGASHFIPWQGAYNQVRTVKVFCDGRQVVHYRESDDPRELNQDNYFVPGAWIDAVLAHRETAQETERARSISLVETERRELLKLLGIGV